MAQFDPLYLEHRRRRFTRPDGHRWIRPNGSHYLKPKPYEHKHDVARTGAADSSTSEDQEAWEQHLEMKRLLAEIRLDLLRLEYLRKYREGQPRDQLGRWTVDGGQATGGGGGKGGSDETPRTRLAAGDESMRPGKKPEAIGGGGGGGRTSGRPSPVQEGGAPTLGSVLTPAGQPVGTKGPPPATRTVAPAEFERLRSDLLTGAKPVTPPRTYDGTAYQRPDGSVIGIRESSRYGTTIDVLKSNNPSIPNGFKVHKK